MAQVANGPLGRQGEQFAVRLLIDRGYDACPFRNPNTRTYDIQVHGHKPFKVSVKTSSTQEVNLGKLQSAVNGLIQGDFVFLLLPAGDKGITFTTGGYRLLIIPADIVRQDGRQVTRDYCESGHWKFCLNNNWETFSNSVRVKKKHSAWTRWNETYEEAWSLIPPPAIM